MRVGRARGWLRDGKTRLWETCLGAAVFDYYAAQKLKCVCVTCFSRVYVHSETRAAVVHVSISFFLHTFGAPSSAELDLVVIFLKKSGTCRIVLPEWWLFSEISGFLKRSGFHFLKPTRSKRVVERVSGIVSDRLQRVLNPGAPGFTPPDFFVLTGRSGTQIDFECGSELMFGILTDIGFECAIQIIVPSQHFNPSILVVVRWLLHFMLVDDIKSVILLLCVVFFSISLWGVCYKICWYINIFSNSFRA